MPGETVADVLQIDYWPLLMRWMKAMEDRYNLTAFLAIQDRDDAETARELGVPAEAVRWAWSDDRALMAAVCAGEQPLQLAFAHVRRFARRWVEGDRPKWATEETPPGIVWDLDCMDMLRALRIRLMAEVAT